MIIVVFDSYSQTSPQVQIDTTGVEAKQQQQQQETKLNLQLSPDLESEVLSLIQETKKNLIDKKKSKGIWSVIWDIIEKILKVISVAFPIIMGIIAIRKKDFLEKHKGLFFTALAFSFSIILVFVFKGIVTAIMFTLLVIGLLIFLSFYATIKYIEVFKEDFRTRKSVFEFITLFTHKENEIPDMPDTYGNILVSSMQSTLNRLKFIQTINQEAELKLETSIIEDSDSMVLKFLPNETTVPHWENIENNLLIPRCIEVIFYKTRKEESLEIGKLINIQAEFIVMKDPNGDLIYNKLDKSGWAKVASEILRINNDKMKNLK